MIADVTVPDNSQMSYGQKFTKTWRFMNNGKCSWSGYTIAFVAGDRMSSPILRPCHKQNLARPWMYLSS